MDRRDAMKTFIYKHHEDDVLSLMNSELDVIFADLTKLEEFDQPLFVTYVRDPFGQQQLWDEQLLVVQHELDKSKAEFLACDFRIRSTSIRFTNLPVRHKGCLERFPTSQMLDTFVQIRGVVFRTNQTKFQEFRREYSCAKCKQKFLIMAEYHLVYLHEPPKKCPTPMCPGRPVTMATSTPNATNLINYQEICVQEMVNKMQKPNTLCVSLEGGLAQAAEPGAKVTVCGVYQNRWATWCGPNKEMEVYEMLRATSVKCDDYETSVGRDLEERMLACRADWEYDIDSHGLLAVRDTLIKSICPSVCGMYMAKFAIALCLATNVQRVEGARSQSHLLMVGDPGLAKSRLLDFAAKIAFRATHTTGLGTSVAGLTATAIKVEGEWQMESGALVMADGGVCCIDEFNLMQEHDRNALHEAMEQQMISINKANHRSVLNTRCVVLAAANPKNLYLMREKEGTSTINMGIGTPLLSRFDLILILCDEPDENWDEQVLRHIVAKYSRRTKGKKQMYGADIWGVDKLQAHFQALRQIDPTMTEEALIVLTNYFDFCRSNPNPDRDMSRTSLRFLDSLTRLARGHARLTMQNQVTVLDAVAVIRLMEATLGFGSLVRPHHVIRGDLPLGPNREQTEEVLRKLQLTDLMPDNSVFDGLYKAYCDRDEHTCDNEEEGAEDEEAVVIIRSQRQKSLSIDLDTLFDDFDEEPADKNGVPVAVVNEPVADDDGPLIEDSELSPTQPPSSLLHGLFQVSKRIKRTQSPPSPTPADFRQRLSAFRFVEAPAEDEIEKEKVKDEPCGMQPDDILDMDLDFDNLTEEDLLR